MKIKFFSAFFFAATISIFAQEAPFQNFITARGDLLMDGDRPFRFISFNIPNLLLVEDNYPFAQTNAWRLPDQFEITDALATVRQMGGTVVRTYSITLARGDNPPTQVSQVLAPGKFNEAAFVVLDRALQVANEQGVRLVIPLVNNWPWMGGRGSDRAACSGGRASWLRPSTPSGARRKSRSHCRMARRLPPPWPAAIRAAISPS